MISLFILRDIFRRRGCWEERRLWITDRIDMGKVMRPLTRVYDYVYGVGNRLTLTETGSMLLTQGCRWPNPIERLSSERMC